MSKGVIKFDYEGQQISFEFADGNKMINATEMAKPFKGKFVADFLRLKSTKDFVVALNIRYGNSHIDRKKEVLDSDIHEIIASSPVNVESIV